jgi:hypothetical protein
VIRASTGIKPITDYLKSLPWRLDLTGSNCEDDRFYMINNTRPGFLSNGKINTDGINAGTAVPPSTGFTETHPSVTYGSLT